MKSYISISLFLLFSLLSTVAHSQFVIDEVLGVVGNEKILLSDIEQERLRMKMQGGAEEGDVNCKVLEDLMVHKLLLHQAEIDSIVVANNTIEGELDRRLKYFVNQVGSEAALEKYFNKTIFQIKVDLRASIQEALLAQQMQSQIVQNVTVTPSEVKRFYRQIPQDSLPTIPEQYEVRQIVMNPPSSETANYAVREKLLSIRERILKGERFATLAVAYSEDRASATRGGEMGFLPREGLVKSFSDVAFSLKEGQVSQIVESEFGFHIIQMIEHRGDEVNVRHILMSPEYTLEQRTKSQSKLDSIATLIRTDSLSFETAAQRFSEDTKTRLSGGLLINGQSNTSLFEREHFAPADYYIIRNLKENEISEPFESRDEHAKIVYKIVKVTRILPQHKANLDDDYAIVQMMAKSKKQQDTFHDWIKAKVKTTYVRIDPSYRNCSFEMEGWVR